MSLEEQDLTSGEQKSLSQCHQSFFTVRTVDALKSIWLKNHQHLYQKIQTLQEVFQNEQEPTQCDLQLLRTHLE